MGSPEERDEPTEPRTEGTVLEEWRSRGFHGGLWLDPPGQEWIDYVHDVDELLMLIAGKLEVTIAGELCRPEIGQEILIPAGAVHTVKNVGTATAQWLYGYRQS